MKKHICLIVGSILLVSSVWGDAEKPCTFGEIQRIEFGDELPESLYNKFEGHPDKPYLQYCLPADYKEDESLPLILFVPGWHGNAGGNVQNAIDVANGRRCVVASLPLFKKEVDRSEPLEGVLISFSDYDVFGPAYKTMLEKLYEAVPNIDKKKSTMVGFSNGAATIAIFVSMHDEYVLEHFHQFCFVDQSVFHLADLHKSPTKKRRFLLLMGEGSEEGHDPWRKLALQRARSVKEFSDFQGVDLEYRIMKNTGHELTDSCKADIGEWIFKDLGE